MNKNSILAYFKDVKNILSSVELLKTENTTRCRTISFGKFSEEFIQMSQDDNYTMLFDIILKNADYDFILKDDAVFQFSCSENTSLENGKIRYAYYPNPYDCRSYEMFLIENGESVEDCGDFYKEEYIQYRSECKIKNNITPIRYDYDFSLYRPMSHPISHIHIGFEQNIRIPVSKMLTPIKFVSFVLKNIYFDKWYSGYADENVCKFFSSAKNQCEKIDDTLFSDIEKQLLYLD